MVKQFVKILLVIVSTLSGILTLIFSYVWVQLWMWDYNEEGNHFDVGTSTNYTDGGVLVYGWLAVLCLGLTLMLMVGWKRLK